MSDLSEALQKYYSREGKRVLFRNNCSLNQLAMAMWEQLGFHQIDSSVLSRVLKGERLFTTPQLKVFCKLLTLSRKEEEYLFACLQQDFVGFKYHGNSIMAAIGLVQLQYLDQDNSCRRKVAKWYDENFANHEVIKRIPTSKDCESSRHLYIIEVPDRGGLIDVLRENEIYPGVHYRNNIDYPMYSYAKGTCPQADYMSNRILSLPLHLRLTRSEVDRICKVIIGALNPKNKRLKRQLEQEVVDYV